MAEGPSESKTGIISSSYPETSAYEEDISSPTSPFQEADDKATIIYHSREYSFPLSPEHSQSLYEPRTEVHLDPDTFQPITTYLPPIGIAQPPYTQAMATSGPS